MSDFLDKLKKAADTGEFNSDAAKKINDVFDLAETKISKSDNPVEEFQKSLEERMNNTNVEVVSADDVAEINSEYENKLKSIKFSEMINKQIVTLIEIDEMVVASIDDMFSFIDELEDKFKDKLEEANSKYNDDFKKNNLEIITLSEYINNMKMKFSKFNNK